MRPTANLGHGGVSVPWVDLMERNPDGNFPGLDEAPSRILRAAIECMRQYGTLKMSMADVAKASGYSRATVYKYFGNRQELVDAVYLQGTRVFFADLKDAASRKQHLPDQMATVARVLMEYLYDDANAPWAGMLDPLDDALITRQHGHDLIAGLAAFATSLVEAAVVRGEIESSLRPAEVGEWLGRILFSAHFTPPEERSIVRTEALLRHLCAALAPR